MKKEQLAVFLGLMVTCVVAGVLTIILAIFLHFFPGTWDVIKLFATFLNYSVALYLGMLSASLRTKALGINPALYVMFSFFIITLLLRFFTSTESLKFSYVMIKFIYSVILLIISFKHAQKLQNNMVGSRRYSRLK